MSLVRLEILFPGNLCKLFYMNYSHFHAFIVMHNAGCIRMGVFAYFDHQYILEWHSSAM